jgi:hypothetical protein
MGNKEDNGFNCQTSPRERSVYHSKCRRIYHTAEGQRRTDFRLASSQPLRCEAETLSEQSKIKAQEDLKRLTSLSEASRNNNTTTATTHVRNHDMPLAAMIAARSFDLDTATAVEKQNAVIRTAASDNNEEEDNDISEVQPKYVSISSRNANVKNADMPLTWKWAASSLQKEKEKQQKQQQRKGIGQGFISNFAESPENLSYDADFATAKNIVNELRKELLNGSEYSASDIEKMIKEKYPEINQNIIAIATNLIMNDAETMQSRVSGVFQTFVF